MRSIEAEGVRWLLTITRDIETVQCLITIDEQFAASWLPGSWLSFWPQFTPCSQYSAHSSIRPEAIDLNYSQTQAEDGGFGSNLRIIRHIAASHKRLPFGLSAAAM